jgi:hypothetical protein
VGVAAVLMLVLMAAGSDFFCFACVHMRVMFECVTHRTNIHNHLHHHHLLLLQIIIIIIIIIIMIRINVSSIHIQRHTCAVPCLHQPAFPIFARLYAYRHVCVCVCLCVLRPFVFHA